MLAADYPFLDVLWTMCIFFLFFIWIWLLITVFADIFRRRDIGGGMKTLWCIFVILLPYLGVFIYLIAEHEGMAERNDRQMQTGTAGDRRLHQVSRRRGRRRRARSRGRRDSSIRVRSRSPNSTPSSEMRWPPGDQASKQAPSPEGTAPISSTCSRRHQLMSPVRRVTLKESASRRSLVLHVLQPKLDE